MINLLNDLVNNKDKLMVNSIICTSNSQLDSTSDYQLYSHRTLVGLKKKDLTSRSMFLSWFWRKSNIVPFWSMTNCFKVDWLFCTCWILLIHFGDEMGCQVIRLTGHGHVQTPSPAVHLGVPRAVLGVPRFRKHVREWTRRTCKLLSYP